MTDDANLVDAIIRGNLAAYHEGKKQAVKEVVEWLRSMCLSWSPESTQISPRPCMKTHRCRMCSAADAIERGEHVNETLKEDA